AIAGLAAFPSILTIGESDVAAMTGTIRHAGLTGTARIRLDSLRVECWNEERQPLAPGVYLDRAALLWNGSEVASITDLSQSAGGFILSLPGLLLEAEETADFQLVIDTEGTAPSTFFELTINSLGIYAVDANSGTRVTAVSDSEMDLPLYSGLTQFRSPARELMVTLENRMPAALAADGSVMTVGIISFTNTAEEGSGIIKLDHLILKAADRIGNPVAVGSVAATLTLYNEDSILGESAVLSYDSMLVKIDFTERLTLTPEQTVDLKIRLEVLETTVIPHFKIGLDKADIGIVQPEGALFVIEARPREGMAFPLWTEVGSFSVASLEESFANFPNPFAAGREQTTFVFYLPENAKVSLTIRSARGEKVVTLIDGVNMTAGLHQNTIWNGKNGRDVTVINGVYVAELIVHPAGGKRERLLHKVAVVR
ncbi:MAG: hypothetical protein ABIH23_06710, partial [bacterium]